MREPTPPDANATIVDTTPDDPPPADDAMVAVVALLERIADKLDAADAGDVLDPAGAASFLKISPAALRALNSRGLMPSPAMIGDGGRMPRWRRVELLTWLNAGAPSRARWLLMRDAAMRRAGAA